MKQFAIVFAIFLASAVTANGAALPDDDDCFCTRIFSPVCGSDGVTYSNMCEFECEAARTNEILTVIKGACLEKDNGCRCAMVFSPVCGSNGVTYKNLCEFQCVASRINERLTVTKGACVSKPMTRQDCNCDRIFSPVCGSDGVTYANECEFECVAVQTPDVVLTSEDGPCMKPKPRQACLCPKIYKPVCGSDGETYANMCEFDCVAEQTTDVVLTAKNGACLPKPMDRQDCNCDRIFSPVCGSDGVTYANECEFECVAEQTTDVVLTSEDGPCMVKPKPRQACLCPKIYKPVCGSNDETYANMCEFECVAEQTTDVVLTAKNGACLPKPMASADCVCDRIFSPVCGSDGITYSNQCVFECVAAENTDVVLTSEDGPCMLKPKARQVCRCPKIYKPVCGSDGETYSNMCEFKCVAEQNTDVVLTAKTGVC